MQQADLFHERIEEAMEEVIRAIGGRKAFAVELWPDKAPRDAHNLIDACLNPDRREKFSPSQILLIAKRGASVGCHALLYFMARECGYDVTPINPKKEVDRLTTVVEQSTKTLAVALATLERLQRGT